MGEEERQMRFKLITQNIVEDTGHSAPWIGPLTLTCFARLAAADSQSNSIFLNWSALPAAFEVKGA